MIVKYSSGQLSGDEPFNAPEAVCPDTNAPRAIKSVSLVRSLKTDDDCYVRMAYVLRTIQARASWSWQVRLGLKCGAQRLHTRRGRGHFDM